MAALETPVQFVKGIGPGIGKTLAAKGISTVEDLLYHLPFRYEDRLNPIPLAELKAGEMASVIGEVRGSALLLTRRMPIFEIVVGQGPSSLKCMWFHGGYLKDKFRAGQMVSVYGKAEPSRSASAGRGFKMINPQVELLPAGADDPETQLLETGRIVPVYESLGQKLSARWQRKLMHSLLGENGELAGTITETLPQALIERLELPSREAALRGVHFPPAGTPLADLQAARTPAQRRLIFEEFFYLELGLELKRRRFQAQAGIAFAADAPVRSALRKLLPFKPTAAQKRALGEIVQDMRKPGPMRRLLQGDVGSGKTIVAIQAMVVAIENGYQAALMAPTEILATQHFLAARKLLDKAPADQAPMAGTAGTLLPASRRYRIVLLTGSLDAERKRLARYRIAAGEADLVIGTHALIEDKVEFSKLGLVVVDEQHRFGVVQRFRLTRKPGEAEPDLLAMTATPIPRTLALTLYGDLDVSVLDELPPGRTPIVTRQVADTKADEVWKFMRAQVGKGRQGYVVYPVIEGAKEDQPELDFALPEAAPEPTRKPARKSSAALFLDPERPPLKAATDMYESLRAGALSGLRLGLLHGRLSADDKDVLMRRFQRGEIDVLIATTVIEVGVDVPNATVMVIEHAERFGLAQMHQLRGRVGRGREKSFCILMTGGRVSEAAEERLAAMVRTQNGFELAELDLELRGPGEFFGTRQSGLPDFRVASLVRDQALLELAKREAARFVEAPEATQEEKAAVWAWLRGPWQRRYGLVGAG